MHRLPYILVLVLYGAVTLGHLVPHWLPAALRDRLRVIALFGAVVHLLMLTLDAFGSQWAPGFPEALSAASLGVIGAYVAIATGKNRALGMLMVPVALVALGTALVAPHEQVSALQHPRPDAVSVWLPIHLLLLFTGVGGFALSGAVGALYIHTHNALKAKRFDIVQRRPALEWLDGVQFRAMFFGFIALTLGIGAGGALAVASFQQFSLLDPKVGYTVFVWVIYLVALQVRIVSGRRGRFTAWFSICGFGLMVFSLVGLNFFLSSSWHGYVG